MTDIKELLETQKAFLEPFLPPDSPSQAWTARPKNRPFVTLTYAQSLDSMIALAPGTRTTLSGSQSKSMTHYLRLKHDAILVGAGTAVVDDPSLNCRYPGAGLNDQPRPVIVDPKRRWSHSREESKVWKLAQEGLGWMPCVFSQGRGFDEVLFDQCDGSDMREASFEAGAPTSPQLSWKTMLETLKTAGIDSVMIEGGATVINSLLDCPDLVDAVIVTIAPTWLGQGGVMVSPPANVGPEGRTNAAWLQDISWHQFGSDVVLCGRPRPKEHNPSAR